MKFVLFVGLTTATSYTQLDESAPLLELAQKTTIFWDTHFYHELLLTPHKWNSVLSQTSANTSIAYQTSPLRSEERIFVKPVELPKCSSNDRVNIYFKMRWNDENQWQLREELCGAVDKLFVSGPDESIYISYDGQVAAKLVFCADEQCEFYRRPEVSSVADREQNDSIMIETPVLDSHTSFPTLKVAVVIVNLCIIRN